MNSLDDLVFALLLASCFTLIVKWSTARTFRFSPPLLFFAVFVLQQYIGCMFLDIPGYPHPVLARAALALGTIGCTLGVGATTILARFRPNPELGRIRGRIELTENHLGEKLSVILLGYVLGCAIMALYFMQSGGMPLFQGISAMVSGDEALAAQQLLKQRRMELTYFEGSAYRGQGYIDQIRMVVLPFLFGCLLVWALGTRRKTRILLAVAAGIPVLLFLAGTGQRHPTLAFLIVLSIVGYTLSRPEQHTKLLTAFGISGLVVFAALTFLLGRYGHTDSLASDLSMVALGLWHRIAYSNAFGTLAVFELFPNPEPYRNGMTWINDLRGFLPGSYVAFSAWLFRRLYGFVGTASPMCFAEMFANFGLAGVFFGATALGMVLQSAQVWWARLPAVRAVHIMIYAVVSMAFARWAMGGLLGPLQFGLLALPPLYACIHVGNLVVHGIRSAIVEGRRSANRRQKSRSSRMHGAGLEGWVGSA